MSADGQAGIASPAAPHKVLLLRRVRLAGRLYRVGEVVDIRGAGSLRCAWGLVSTQQARPADPQTARDVELFDALRKIDSTAA